MINLVVTHLDNQVGYYTLPDDRGYKVDPANRCIRICSSPPLWIPLDNVRSWTTEATGVDS